MNFGVFSIVLHFGICQVDKISFNLQKQQADFNKVVQFNNKKQKPNYLSFFCNTRCQPKNFFGEVATVAMSGFLCGREFGKVYSH